MICPLCTNRCVVTTTANTPTPTPTPTPHRGWPTLPFAKALVLLRLRILPEVYVENSRCDRVHETETEVEVQVTLL